MQEIYKLVVGILFLLLGIPIGILLAKKTKEELKAGQKWFRIIILVSLIGGMIGLILREDIILFSSSFIAIVTSKSLEKR